MLNFKTSNFKNWLRCCEQLRHINPDLCDFDKIIANIQQLNKLIRLLKNTELFSQSDSELLVAQLLNHEQVSVYFAGTLLKATSKDQDITNLVKDYEVYRNKLGHFMDKFKFIVEQQNCQSIPSSERVARLLEQILNLNLEALASPEELLFPIEEDLESQSLQQQKLAAQKRAVQRQIDILCNPTPFSCQPNSATKPIEQVLHTQTIITATLPAESVMNINNTSFVHPDTIQVQTQHRFINQHLTASLELAGSKSIVRPPKHLKNQKPKSLLAKLLHSTAAQTAVAETPLIEPVINTSSTPAYWENVQPQSQLSFINQDLAAISAIRSYTTQFFTVPVRTKFNEFAQTASKNILYHSY